MKPRFCLPLLLILPCCMYAQFKVSFQIKQPANHSSDSIFIAGSFNNWNPSLFESSFTPDSSGSGSYELRLPAGSYEYKFTRGGWNKVECRANGGDIANRELVVRNDTSLAVTIGGWKDDFPQQAFTKRNTASSQVKVLDSAFNMPQLKRKRRIWIYLPADYTLSKKSYPVIYMHDGQNLFDEATAGFGEWGVDEYLDSLSAEEKKCIIVGIGNGNNNRMTEYNPYYFAKAGAGEGKQYVDFLVKTLKPYIDRHFRTISGKANTFIAGSSMGGLISFYAVLRYPVVFGGAGIFSPAFWTANGIDKDVKQLGAKVHSKLFFYAGGRESDQMVPDMKRLENEIQTVSKSPIREVIDPDARHNEVAWRKYFPAFYQWITASPAPAASVNSGAGLRSRK